MSTQETPDHEEQDRDSAVEARAHADSKPRASKTPRSKKGWDKKTRRRHSLSTPAFSPTENSTDQAQSDQPDPATEDFEATEEPAIDLPVEQESPAEDQPAQEPAAESRADHETSTEDQQAEESVGEGLAEDVLDESNFNEDNLAEAASNEDVSTEEDPIEEDSAEGPTVAPADPASKPQKRKLDESFVSDFDDDFYDSLDLPGADATDSHSTVDKPGEPVSQSNADAPTDAPAETAAETDIEDAIEESVDEVNTRGVVDEESFDRAPDLEESFSTASDLEAPSSFDVDPDFEPSLEPALDLDGDSAPDDLEDQLDEAFVEAATDNFIGELEDDGPTEPIAPVELDTEASAAEIEALTKDYSVPASDPTPSPAPVPAPTPEPTPAPEPQSETKRPTRRKRERKNDRPEPTPRKHSEQKPEPKPAVKSEPTPRKRPERKPTSAPEPQLKPEPTPRKRPKPKPKPKQNQKPEPKPAQKPKYLKSRTLEQAFRNLLRLNGGAAWRETRWPIVIFFVLFGLLALAVADGLPAVDSFNATINSAIHSLRGTFDPAIVALTTIGDVLPMTGICLVVCLILCAAKKWDSLAFFFTNVVLATVCVQALKLIFAVPRPASETLVPIPISFSFPSAHSFCSLIVFGMIGLLIFRAFYRRGVARNLAMIPGIILIVLAILVGLSRIYVGVHWPSDVLGGWLLAGLWLSFAGALYTAGARTNSRA